jgi:hypothetical protein
VWQGHPAYYCWHEVTPGAPITFNEYYCGPTGGVCLDGANDCFHPCIDERGEGGSIYCDSPCINTPCATGCCDGTIRHSCHDGDVDSNCGTGNAMCAACPAGQHCVQQACVVIPDGGAADGPLPDGGPGD